MSERPLETEEQLIERIRSIDERAPEALHGRIAALVAERGSRRRAPLLGRVPAPPRVLAGAAAAAVAAVVALVLALSGGGASTAPRLSAASALTLAPATMAAPAESASNRRELAAAVDGVSFPYWERLGWRSVGARTDRVGGRAVTTVFYANPRGQRVGYAIVAGTPAARISGGTVHWHNGTPYRLLRLNGAGTVAWLRDGRLCIVSGRGVSDATLLRLAGWDDRSSVAA